MNIEAREALYEQWESAVAFRLFAEDHQPTLTLPEQIAAHFGDRIISGVLPPGTRVLEQEIATEFGISRGPVRDAIHLLEREGLVTVFSRRGAVVTELTAAEVREIFEIRSGLTEMVSRKIMQRRDEPEVVRLIAILKAGVAQLQRLAKLDDDQGAYAETAYRLSILQARHCGNRRLARMVTSLSLQTLRYSKLGLASKARRKASSCLWSQSLVAIERGDLEQFMSLARQRVEASGAEAARLLMPDPGEAEASAAPRSGSRSAPTV